jgi:tRNA-uridine 2-sulfurtransferase
MNAPKKEKVVIAVGSSIASHVTSVLLKKQGYQLLGVYFQTSDALGAVDGVTAEILEKKLQIPVQTIDVRNAMDELIPSRMEEELLAGMRPQPLAHFSQRIFFKELFKAAASAGAKKVATGHGAQIFSDGPSGNATLAVSVDQSMDQAIHFLGLQEEELSQLILPFGGFTRPLLKRLAVELGLDASGFVFKHIFSGEGEWAINEEFRKKFRAQIAPDLSGAGQIHSDAGLLGGHSGIHHFTPGDIYPHTSETGEAQDWVVRYVDLNQRLVLVGPESLRKVMTAELFGAKVWDASARVQTQAYELRYRNDRPGASAWVTFYEDGSASAEFPEALHDLYPGQFVSFVRGGRVFGGAQVRRVS